MSHTDEPIPQSPGAGLSHVPASIALIVARVAAIVMAISIVSCFVWDAQTSAGVDATPAGPAGLGTPARAGQAGGDLAEPGRGSEVLMPSSKFAPVDFFGPATGNGAPPTRSADVGSEILLSGSKSALLPSSKVIVLPSSKSGAPVTAEASDVMKKVVQELNRKIENKKQSGATKANKD